MFFLCRLGLCWEVLAESGCDELRQPHVRDPYPLIAEKAGSLKGPKVGKAFRFIASGKLDTVFFLIHKKSWVAEILIT